MKTNTALTELEPVGDDTVHSFPRCAHPRRRFPCRGGRSHGHCRQGGAVVGVDRGGQPVGSAGRAGARSRNDGGRDHARGGVRPGRYSHLATGHARRPRRQSRRRRAAFRVSSAASLPVVRTLGTGTARTSLAVRCGLARGPGRAGGTGVLHLRTRRPAAPEEMGIILGVAVVLDAVLVRLVLLPVILRSTGHAAWWTPAWLRRALPTISFAHH